jgi:hypothetical protein
MREAAIIVRCVMHNFIDTRWQQFIMAAQTEPVKQSKTCAATVIAKPRRYQIEPRQRN